MHDDGHLRRHLLEHVARIAVVVDEIFADDLEPVHLRPVAQDVLIVRRAQPHAQAEVRQAQARPRLVQDAPHQVDGGKARRRSVGAGGAPTGVPRAAITLP
ncbi:hypothetical protein D3C72_1094250 [compost metagenome]